MGLESGRLAKSVNVLSLRFAKPMRTWFVATAKLKQPIRTAIIEDDPALRKMIVSLLQADSDYAVVAEFAEGGAAIAAMPRHSTVTYRSRAFRGREIDAALALLLRCAPRPALWRA